MLSGLVSKRNVKTSANETLAFEVSQFCDDIYMVQKKINKNLLKKFQQKFLLLQIVAKNDGPIRVLGSGHSFNKICDSKNVLISLAYLRNVIDLDIDKMTVTVEGGATYGDLAKYQNCFAHSLNCWLVQNKIFFFQKNKSK